MAEKDKENLLVAGVDEAGRGPLAGPVIAAAVILNPKKRIIGLKDSKLLTPLRREALFPQIISKALAFGIGRAEVHEIEQINILQASLLAMKRAIAKLGLRPDRVLIDGNKCPDLEYPSEAIVDGDKKIKAISAASILAKVIRDKEMAELDKQFPGYGFAKHKGYGTEEHHRALQKLGLCKIHRKSFAPCRAFLSPDEALLIGAFDSEEEALEALT